MWCTELTHLVHRLHLFLPCVMCSRYVLLSRVLLPSSQLVSTIVQEVFSVVHALVA